MSKYTGQTPSRSTVSGSASNLKPRGSISPGGSVTGFSKDYEEFASLQLDRPIEGELKTSDEMKRHLLDDHFEGRPIERAMHLLAVGEEVQKLSVIRQLLQLLQTDEIGCMQRVFPKIQQTLSTATTEFHIETAKAFTTILERKAVSTAAFAQTFLPSILNHVDNRDQAVSSAWLDTLLEASEKLPVDIVRHEVLHVAVSKGQISQSVWHRIAACKLLGKMCMRFDQHSVKKDILPVVHSLCQDVNEAVRASICSQLHHVAKGLPAEMVKPALIPILVELGRDETVQVRMEATETIVNMIPYLSQEVLKITIVPLVKKICEQAVLAMDDTLIMVAKQFGSLCIGLENSLSVNEKFWMVSYYHNMSHLGIPSQGIKKDMYATTYSMDRVNTRHIECRQLCAYNFPAMSKFCASNPELLEKLYPSFCDFSTDPYFMVRKTIGCGMHEVARILGSNNRIVKNQVMTLLWDNMEEVLMGIVPQLGRTIELLITSGVLGQEQDGSTAELGRGLLQCDKTIRDKTHNWRLYSDFIKQLESIVRCLPSDYIYTHFVSLMFDKMHRARPLPCRLAAARTLLVFLRHNLKYNQRQEIRSRIQAEFCLSSSCYKRMLFLRLCIIAREIFSRSYFKEHFFFLLLSRSDDKVANNRLLLVRQLPHLKAMIVMPNERKYLQSLETCIRNMAATEKDKDVTAELRLSVARLDKTDTLTESPTMTTPEDIEDKKKFDEEVKLATLSPRGAGVPMAAVDARRVAPKPGEKISSAVQKPAEKPAAVPQKPVEKSAAVPQKPAEKSVVVPQKSAERPISYATAAANTPKSTPTTPRDGGTPSRPNHISTQPSIMSQGGQSHNSSTSAASLSSVRGNYVSSQSVSQAPVAVRRVPPNLPNTGSQILTQPTPQSFTNATNINPLRPALALLNLSNHHNCTCYSNFHSDYLRNLNLRALIDTNLDRSDYKLTEGTKEKITSDISNKLRNSCKYSMEISWLNLETDLRRELMYLAKGGKIQGDRNLKEKNSFLTDFRHFNEPSLTKFINEDREYKETIYNVRGDSNTYSSKINFFEERINFFERKIKMNGSVTNKNYVDCSCVDLTTNQSKFFEANENKKFSYFSKSFEQDFYRDAGVRANDIIGRRISGIPVSATQSSSSSPKISGMGSNRRRTWFGNEGLALNDISLEALCKITTDNENRTVQRKKSETLPLRESISLEKIGIGPRSKSFVLPSTVINSDKQVTNHQTTKSVVAKTLVKVDKLGIDGLEQKNYFNKVNNHNKTNDSNGNEFKSSNVGQGAIRKLRGENDGNRFGFRQKPRDKSPKADSRPLPKTKIPIGQGCNGSSPNGSRSASPSCTTAPKENDTKAGKTKKIPVVTSRKSLVVQSSTSNPKPDTRINRRSLDPSKLNIAQINKSGPKIPNRKNDRGAGQNERKLPVEEKADSDVLLSATNSKLPVRRPRPPDK